MSEWITKPLGSLGRYINGRAFKPEDWKTSGLPIIRIENLNDPKATYNYFQGQIEDQYNVDTGDILVSWSASLDVYIWNGGPAVLNQHIFKVIPNEEIADKGFLFFLLKKAIGGLIELVHGATMKHINKPVFENFEINFPESIAEQQRIAAELTAQLAEVEKAKAATICQLEEVQHLANALIYESLNNGLTTNHPLGDVLTEVKHGIGSTWHTYPVYGATRAGLALAKEPPGKTPQRYKPVVAGTVFYNPMRILIGSIAYAETDDEAGITSPDYVVLQGKAGLVDSRWFYYWLRSPLGEQCINSLARGAVRERMLFNRLAEGLIDLPDFASQQRASVLLATLKPLRASLLNQLNDLKRMPERLLAAVFQAS